MQLRLKKCGAEVGWGERARPLPGGISGSLLLLTCTGFEEGRPDKRLCTSPELGSHMRRA